MTAPPLTAADPRCYLHHMSCALPHLSAPISELVRTPFLYPSSMAWLSAERVLVEIGPGRGDFLFHLAESNPKASVVGIEIKRRRVDKLIMRIERRGLTNVAIIQDDARDALPRFFPDARVDEIHINFPDPWPKRRHAKNRAVDRGLLLECCRALKPGGTVAIATDCGPYAERIADDASGVAGLVSCHGEAIGDEPADAYPTLFALKWKGEGRRIAYQKYARAMK